MGPHGQAAEHAGPLYQVPESNAAPYELSDQMQQAALDNWVPVNRHRYRVYPGISVTGTPALVTIDSFRQGSNELIIIERGCYLI